MTNRTWTGQMKQGFNNPWGDLNGFGSGGEYTEEEEAEDQRCVNRTVANINEYKRLIQVEKNRSHTSKHIRLCLDLVLKKVVIDKHFNVSQQEVDTRYNQYFNTLSKSTTHKRLMKNLDSICKLNY